LSVGDVETRVDQGIPTVCVTLLQSQHTERKDVPRSAR
jgi:hypothetical protein